MPPEAVCTGNMYKGRRRRETSGRDPVYSQRTQHGERVPSNFLVQGGRGVPRHLSFLRSLCQLWRIAQCESLELSFTGGKMRTAAQGDGTSDNSEKLLQRGRGEGEASMYVALVKGECMQSSTYFFLKVSASHKEQSSL